jgi:hypothetical protein
MTASRKRNTENRLRMVGSMPGVASGRPDSSQGA